MRGDRILAVRLAALGVAASAAIVAGCGSAASAASADPPLPQVSVAAAIRRPVTDWQEFTGRLEAVDRVEVRPRVSGYIRRIAFEEGTEVRKGQVLFEIDSRPYAADVAGAEADLAKARTSAELARTEEARAKRLIAVQAISQQEYDIRTSDVAKTEAAVHAAEAALERARLDLRWTKVRAPIGGRVGRAQVTPGNLVAAGSSGGPPLTTVVSLDPIYVYFDGDEQTYLRYGRQERAGAHPGSKAPPVTVEMGLADETGYPHRGHIDFVDNRVDPQTGTIRMRGVFSNQDHLFTPGLFARIRIAGGGRHPAVLVQDRAIGTDQDRKYVLVVKPDSTLVYRGVQLGALEGDLRVVERGVEPGDRVVIRGLQRVRPGVKVAWTTQPMAHDSAASAPGSN